MCGRVGGRRSRRLWSELQKKTSWRFASTFSGSAPGLVEVHERWRASITRGLATSERSDIASLSSLSSLRGPSGRMPLDGGVRSGSSINAQSSLTCFILSARCACDSRCAARSIFCARFLLEPPEVESRLLPPKSREKNPPFCIAFRLFARCM